MDGLDTLDHAQLHSASRRIPQDDLIHKTAYQKYAATGRLEHVLRCEGIGHPGKVEAATFVSDTDFNAGRRLGGKRRKFNVHPLPLVVAVSVLDRIDHALSNRHADPMDSVVIEPGLATQMVADDLDEVESPEITPKVQAHGVPSRHQRDC